MLTSITSEKTSEFGNISTMMLDPLTITHDLLSPNRQPVEVKRMSRSIFSHIYNDVLSEAETTLGARLSMFDKISKSVHKNLQNVGLFLSVSFGSSVVLFPCDASISGREYLCQPFLRLSAQSGPT